MEARIRLAISPMPSTRRALRLESAAASSLKVMTRVRWWSYCFSTQLPWNGVTQQRRQRCGDPPSSISSHDPQASPISVRRWLGETWLAIGGTGGTGDSTAC
jgi:3'-phosphoadenosine 5'-phosphosulfate sulfotransferase (PAPS reductase)/FAD synthetase